MSTSNISRMHNEVIKSLAGDTVRGLAAGLDVSVRQVVTAFLRSMDLPVNDEPMSVEEALRKELYPRNIRHMVLDMLARYRHDPPD